MPKFFDQAQPDAQPPLEPVQPLERYAWTQPEAPLPPSPGPSEAVDVDNAPGPAAQAHNPGIPVPDPAERAPSPPITPPRKYGRAILSAALGVALAAGLGVSLLRSPSPDSSVSLRDRTTTEAPPAPTPNTVGTVAPTTTEQPAASTSTLPRPTTTAPTTKPSTPNVPASTTTLAAEKAPESSLTTADITALKASGFEGINKNHDIEVIQRVGDAVLISVDGARPSEEHIKNLEREIKAAKMIAASKPSFTTHLKLGPDTERDITYNVGPAAAIDMHYFVFSNGDITQLALPVDVSGFPNEYTKAAPRNRTSVTVVKMQPVGSNVEGIDAQSHYMGVGAWQAYVAVETAQASQDMIIKDVKAGVDMSYLTNPDPQYDSLTLINLLGTELANNTGDDMYAYSQAGKGTYSKANPVNYTIATRFVGAKKLQGVYARNEAQFPAGSMMPEKLFAELQSAA